MATLPCRLYNQPSYLPPTILTEHLPAYQPTPLLSSPSTCQPASLPAYQPTSQPTDLHTHRPHLPAQCPLPASTQ